VRTDTLADKNEIHRYEYYTGGYHTGRCATFRRPFIGFQLQRAALGTVTEYTRECYIETYGLK